VWNNNNKWKIDALLFSVEQLSAQLTTLTEDPAVALATVNASSHAAPAATAATAAATADCFAWLWERDSHEVEVDDTGLDAGESTPEGNGETMM
jgi:hypothetical protein